MHSFVSQAILQTLHAKLATFSFLTRRRLVSTMCKEPLPSSYFLLFSMYFWIRMAAPLSFWSDEAFQRNIWWSSLYVVLSHKLEAILNIKFLNHVSVWLPENLWIFLDSGTISGSKRTQLFDCCLLRFSFDNPSLSNDTLWDQFQGLMEDIPLHYQQQQVQELYFNSSRLYCSNRLTRAISSKISEFSIQLAMLQCYVGRCDQISLEKKQAPRKLSFLVIIAIAFGPN